MNQRRHLSTVAGRGLRSAEEVQYSGLWLQGPHPDSRSHLKFSEIKLKSQHTVFHNKAEQDALKTQKLAVSIEHLNTAVYIILWAIFRIIWWVNVLLSLLKKKSQLLPETLGSTQIQTPEAKPICFIYISIMHIYRETVKISESNRVQKQFLDILSFRNQKES